jgi:hypothetical protein
MLFLVIVLVREKKVRKTNLDRLIRNSTPVLTAAKGHAWKNQASTIL